MASSYWQQGQHIQPKALAFRRATAHRIACAMKKAKKPKQTAACATIIQNTKAIPLGVLIFSALKAVTRQEVKNLSDTSETRNAATPIQL